MTSTTRLNFSFPLLLPFFVFCSSRQRQQEQKVQANDDSSSACDFFFRAFTRGLPTFFFSALLTGARTELLRYPSAFKCRWRTPVSREKPFTLLSKFFRPTVHNTMSGASATTSTSKHVDDNVRNSKSNDDNHTAPSSTPAADPACAPCVKLLREILVQDSSARPRQLLSALSPHSAWRPMANGLEVQIPNSVDMPQRRFSRLHPPDQATTTRSARTTAPSSAILQATSADPSSRLHQIENDNDDTSNNYQWMQIVCKRCSNVGPEAKARAFVMGPTPLSMVVCTNRLYGESKKERRMEMEEILTHEFVHVYDVRVRARLVLEESIVCCGLVLLNLYSFALLCSFLVNDRNCNWI